MDTKTVSAKDGRTGLSKVLNPTTNDEVARLQQVDCGGAGVVHICEAKEYGQTCKCHDAASCDPVPNHVRGLPQSNSSGRLSVHHLMPLRDCVAYPDSREGLPRALL